MIDRWTWQIVLITFLVFVALIYFLSPILTPFLIAAFLAYLTNPLVNRLVKWGLSRLFATLIVFSGLFFTITLLLLLLIPLIEDQLIVLAELIPTMIAWAESMLSSALRYFHVPEINPETLKNNIANAQTVATWVGKKVFYSGLALIEVIMALVLIPVVTFYLLRDWNKLLSNIQKLLPRSIEPTVTQLAKQCDLVLGQFIRGQLLVMLGLGIVYSIGLSLMGLKVGIIIGLISGLASIVPYLGFIVGIVSASIAAWLQFGTLMHLLLVILVYMIGQAIEGMVLTPNLVGNRVGLHPVAVIFAVLAGGTLFGFLGVLLALPVASVLMVLIRYMTHQYEKSAFYKKK